MELAEEIEPIPVASERMSLRAIRHRLEVSIGFFVPPL